MGIINYPVSVPYRVVPNMRGTQPAAEVTIFHASQSALAVGIFDSGSIYSTFSPEYATLIGIEDVTSGTREDISTLAGPRPIFLFDLEVQLGIIGPRFAAQIGFFEGRVSRNILGRSVFFSAFEIGFQEQAGILNFRSVI